MASDVDGIILAAGLSTRMGVPKVLLELEGVPLVLRVMRAALESRLRNVIVVVDSSKLDLMDRLSRSEQPRLRIVVNPHPEDGMSSSLKLGITDTEPASIGAMVLLADQPLVTGEVIDDLLAIFAARDGMIVLPTIHGRRTTPALFPRHLFAELLEITGDVGGREVIKRHEELVVTLELSSRYDDADIDTPEDVKALAGRVRAKNGLER